MSRYISPVLYVLLMLVGCIAFISIAGVRVGIFEPITGFSMLRKSVFASLVLSLLAAVSLGVCRKEKNIACQRFFFLVLIVSLVYSIMWIGFYLQRSGLPDINDITTDTDVPPAFLNVNFIRKSQENDLRYNSEWAPIQHKYYPDVQPLFSTKSKTAVYSAITALVEERGWDVVAMYSGAGIIEATARTPIFGFRDDVVIRITQIEPKKIRIDMRSCSRVGSGDFGVNAERIVSFMTDLSESLSRSSMPNLSSMR
ncbi:MAG: DUF1499 domain-containing protein [Gammaproteobacteria bacterium]|uniref:DUF1499 domain-containing protein n=1 Tax=Marinomonas sp. ef1 TaxID=2005043 RepID=UPI000C28AF01|nr:DUF1499 domain-containing protein [Marinomonas sp. ef1]MBU1294319.1 DUF1499 domain-containing protein [Gammaproteobacteria bacterium]MBU1465966.1 DUF1499 domain-containing protein [Gammaproteobacteria bacterium]MBU2021638.1 DUF1499 domain-containing protein [Gammaproteobacteria bacterium]MBU2236643.1 DUF1499 domain-containing protein [Gammaproteobacteria bacterium]MBU2321184.1 DUF1499 domain-containing protein [Gammaproteobacteria bacterium]